MQLLSVESYYKPHCMANNASCLVEVRDAYSRLTHHQLVLFCSIRSLPTSGSDEELAARLADHDLHTYSIPQYGLFINGHTVNGTSHPPPPKQRPRHVKAPDLPVEILAEIMDHVGDWELAKAVGVPTSLSQPVAWTRASQTDHAILTGYLPLIRAADPAAHPPTHVGAALAVRFGYVNVLDYFLTNHTATFRTLFKDGVIPITASHHGRVSVLSWWRNSSQHYPDVVLKPTPSVISEAIDGASRNGQVASLDWWLHSGLELYYTEAALEMASAKNQIEVLDWWRTQHRLRHLPLKIGRVMEQASTTGHVEVLEWWARSQLEFKYDRSAMFLASCHGKVDVLQWWHDSNLQSIFDPECLVGATKHNRPEVLEWWDKSSLPIQYRMCDIEEALEDAIGGGEAAREWWRKKGVDFNANDTEWMKLRNLN
ncbi:hypothetical protein K474DRAFT_1640004 [Panus rudis PR-1116 ss-1]|nr:hypothetical protein K474DRAFT_1640004 [Panus rudis PR-1116 ss-1]